MTTPHRALLVLLLAFVPMVAAPVPASAAVATTANQSTYVPQAPRRLLDTRQSTGPVGAGQFLDLALQLPGNATAAVLNVTATAATGTTVIRVFPTPVSGTAAPTVSNLNVLRGVTVADLVVTKIGAAGQVRLRNDSGSVQLVVDLAGYYVDGGAGDGFFETAPQRLLDTRTAQNPLRAGVPRLLDVQHTATLADSGVPANASAVVMNVTAVKPTITTVLRVYPGDAAPTVSNLNPAKGQVVANLVVVAVQNGSVNLLSSAGTTDVVVDLAGWFVPGSGDVFHPVDPFRVLDTRQSDRVLAGSPRALVLAGSTSLPWSAKAVALTVTAVTPTTNTFVTVYPYQSEAASPPTASNLNLLAGQVVPNAAVVSAGEGGTVLIANAAQQVDVVVDVAGWFGPPADGADISWPQCTAAGAPTSNHPASASFAVIGLTHGTFTANSCLADEWSWASSLGAPPAAYLNLDANTANAHWADAGPQQATCDANQATSSCGFNYGWNVVGFVSGTIPTTPDGGRPFVWLDVEGPYSSGPFWTSSVATNRAVLTGAISRLTGLGYRVGIYSDRPSSTSPDWKNIMGVYSLPTVQDWVFRATSASAASVCTPAESFSGGPVVMEQISTTQSGLSYDVDHSC